MSPASRRRTGLTRRLGFRLAVMLSIALIPLGLISVLQTVRVIDLARTSSEVALLGRTAEAADAERALIQAGFGAAEALGHVVYDTMRADPAACRTMLADFIERSALFSFAGFIELDAMMRCSSATDEIDLSQTTGLMADTQKPRKQVLVSPFGAISKTSVLIISQPVYDGGDRLVGFMSVSLPHRRVDLARRFGDARPLHIMTFNDKGRILTSDTGLAEAENQMPMNVPLEVLAGDREQSFRDVNRWGEARVFSVVPIVAGSVYALGSWEPDESLLRPERINPLMLLFPLSMWLASLGVAYLAVHRLVIRHLRTLRGQMRRYALGQRDEPPEVLEDAPAEIHEASHTFHNLARILTRDEAQLEAAVREKTVLLKEVHHRVKNNLQLISSIMNMQSRRAEHDETRRVLRSVQDRIMSLATIHRNLYQSESLSEVRADRLLSEIINQIVAMGAPPGSHIQVETALDPVTLYPDQAVPLALAATEAMMNALKYAGVPEPSAAPDGGTPRAVPAAIRAMLRSDAAGLVTFEITNTRNPALVAAGGQTGPAGPQNVAQGAGLGSQLIAAFAAQLGGETEILDQPDLYRLRLSFAAADFVPE
jgi:two-component sensor histidine kinase